MILAYQLKVGALLVVFYLLFKLLLSRDTFHRFNRVALLLLALLAVVLPWVRLSIEQPAAAVVSIEALLPVDLVATASPQAERLSWTALARTFYYIGLVAMLLFHVISLWRLRRLLHQGREEVLDDGIRLHVLPGEVSPFSYFRHIVMSEDDYRENGQEILIHERAHIRMLHSADVARMDLLIVMQWWNPAAWLLKHELQQVHEFEADEAVLKRGVDARQYQLLLIRKSVGNQLFSMANNLNHQSLKRRISMMTTTKSNRWQRLKLLAVAPVAALAVVAFASPKVENVVEQIETEPAAPVVQMVKELVQPADNAKKQKPMPEVVLVSAGMQPLDPSKKDRAFDVVEQMPAFPGGISELMKFLNANVRYPKEAEQQGKQGRVIVTFVVDADGTVTDPEVVRPIDPLLDAEAMRVISTMPKWLPGKQNGKNVRVKYTMPITFKLSKDEEEEPYVEAYEVAKKAMSNGSLELGNVQVVLDGKPVGNLSLPDPKIIKSMSVAKDAETLKRYGAEDKQAVIMIETTLADKE